MSDVSPRTQAIVSAPWSVSDKIRALNADGHPRAEIARLLGKRYQYVRNVLEGDRLKRVSRQTAPNPPAQVGVAEGAAAFVDKTYRLELGEDGAVRLPAPVLTALKLGPGDIIVTEVHADRLVLLTPEAAIAKVQEMLRDFAPGVSLSEELIADRRREFERE